MAVFVPLLPPEGNPVQGHGTLDEELRAVLQLVGRLVPL